MALLLTAIIVLGISFYLMGVVCDRYFVPSLDEFADRYRLPHDIVGAVFMAAGSSAPELFVVLFSLFLPGNTENIGVGMIVGSAMVNTLVIVGLSITVKRSRFTWQPVVRDFLFYALTLVLMLMVFWDGIVQRHEAWYLLGLYALYLLAMPVWRKLFPYTTTTDILEEREKIALEYGPESEKFVEKVLSFVIPDVIRMPNAYLWTFFMSLMVIAGLAYLLVESVVIIADVMNINATLISLSVVAIGSSIPDMISSIIVSKKGKADMMMSNVVGSNIFDITIALGLPWTIYFLIYPQQTINIDRSNLEGSVILLFATIVAVLGVLIVRRWTVGFKTGLVLIGLYCSYLGYITWMLTL